MPLLIPLKLFYDPGKGTWTFYSKKPTNPFKHLNLFWGVPLTPACIAACGEMEATAVLLPVKAMVKPGRRAVMGPVIGILSAEKRDGTLKGNYNNYKAIMNAGRQIGGIVFAFTPSSVDWENKSIRGNMYDHHNNRWVTAHFPFPNVVYNRIHNRKHEKTKSSQVCIHRFLSHSGITLFNTGFFNKKDVISLLGRSPIIRNFVPETIPFLSKEELFNMINRHEALYLKPVDSRLGSGIIRVARSQSKKRYMIQYYAGDKVLTGKKVPGIDQLWEEVHHNMLGSQYIIQQAIPLAVTSGDPFDCRVLVQKNRRGSWQVSGMGIRVAGHSRSITTHVPRGGRIDSPARVLRQAFPNKRPAQTEKRIGRLSLAVAGIMEQRYYPLGEISLDIGLDQRGHPWIFEVNAKPMKFDEPEIRKRQLGQIIRYARFLTFRGSSSS